MKHLGFLIVVLLAAPLYASLQSEYKSAQAEVVRLDAVGNVEQLRIATEHFCRLALQLKKPGMAAWKFNNLGYRYYQEFCKLTDLETIQDTFNGIRPGVDRDEYRKDMQNIMRKHVHLLIDAYNFLMLAKQLASESQLVSVERDEKIANNLKVVMGVLKDATGKEFPSQYPKKAR